jgi:putative SOS response-associated peptidase YedK
MSKATGDLLSHFEATEIEGSPPPSLNVAPTQDVPIIVERVEDDSVHRR